LLDAAIYIYSSYIKNRAKYSIRGDIIESIGVNLEV